LSVGKKRSDGYHAFESLMVTISLYDDIIFRPGNGSIKLSCDDPMVPCDERNLVYRAAKVLADSAGINPSVEIELIKRIPSQAGLGGGSSDAAATLWALNDYWKIGYSVSELTCLAEKLGSDVGFFLHGPVGVCSGRGEIIDPVDVRFDFFAVLVKPDVSISTADAYRAHLPSDQLIPRARQLANRLSGSKPSDIYPYLTNDLEEAAYRVSPEVGELKNQLQRIVSVPVMLSGSGSALFALFDTLDQAMQAAESISNVFGELTYWVIQNNAW
jgi:4-diphosphocytidyl-2-C-methyl-D-erythritol kinase